MKSLKNYFYWGISWEKLKLHTKEDIGSHCKDSTGIFLPLQTDNIEKHGK